MSSDRTDIPLNASAAAVVDLPAALLPHRTTACPPTQTALACSAVTPRLRRINPITGPTRYVVKSSIVYPGGDVAHTRFAAPSIRNRAPSLEANSKYSSDP